MTIGSQNDLDGLSRASRLVARCMHTMAAALEPGITTAELDAIGADILAAAGARPAPALTYGFPAATCISVNHVVAHGLPSEQVVAAGDLVNIDVSAELDGYFGDTGGSFAVPPVSPRASKLLAATREARDAGIRAARAGRPLREIGRAISAVADRRGYRVIPSLCSHGVGRALHEEPGFIPPYDDPFDRRRLHDGLVITVEPFLTTGSGQVRTGADGWSVVAEPGTLSAQFEHTIVVRRGRPRVMTRAAA